MRCTESYTEDKRDRKDIQPLDIDDDHHDDDASQIKCQSVHVQCVDYMGRMKKGVASL